jgi:hypothetical protein
MGQLDRIGMSDQRRTLSSTCAIAASVSSE